MHKKERFRHFLDFFEITQPNAETELHYSNSYELLVAVILSAQCTDKRINMVTPAIFKIFPTSHHLAASNFDELFPYIKSVSYPNNKTKHLLGMARLLVNEFQGEVPDNVKDLQKLPGVGRKTANVIVSVVYNQPALAVDTHVFRVSKRLGLATQSAKTPFEVETQLMRHIPKVLVPKAHHWLILHGRYVCIARKPKCDICPLTNICLFYKKNVINYI
ncbi:MAG: endonuclease III [Bacteroidota bacterium]|nr:endonuclease III [Bacteroidota bacterium]